MASKFAEKEQVVPVRIELPVASRVEHHPLETLGRCASHLNMRSESAHADPIEADRHCRIAANVSALKLEGTRPLESRFAELVRSLPVREG